MLSVRFEEGVPLLLAPDGADKRGPFSSGGKCRNRAGDSQESTCRSSGGSRVLLKALNLLKVGQTDYHADPSMSNTPKLSRFV